MSEDSWLVGCLAGAAFAAVLYFNIMAGPLSENLGLIRSEQAQLASSLGDDDNSHPSSSTLYTEHAELFNMVPQAAATHIAVGSGSWFNASTWQGGAIPGDNAQVLIPENIKVTYGAKSDARVKWVRVDGELSFDVAADSKLVVDTLIVDADGKLTAGTKSNPVTGLVDIVIANNGDIDVNWDHLLQSRGVISHGIVEMNGEPKLVHGKVAADPKKGDISISLKDTPVNWQIGDKVVIAGADYLGYTYDNACSCTRWWGTEDEVRSVTGISGKTISLDQPLAYNHTSPRSDLKVSVANYSRTVTIRSEQGANAPIHQRGHAMMMHSSKIDIRYAAFDHLGRTDKSKSSLEAIAFSPITPTSNARGRYALHIHRVGTSNPQNPAILIGNAVFTSPGWGFVHHDSNALFHNNASYDTFGAGFVAETGNEIGSWTKNIAIKAQGVDVIHKDGAHVTKFDNAATGAGFWFQGRMVHSANNVAASTRTGYVFMHRTGSSPGTTGMISFPAKSYFLSEGVYNGIEYPYDNKNTELMVNPDDTPIIRFAGNETFASDQGVYVAKNNPVQGHDIRTRMLDFTAWNVEEGAHISYTAHYTLENFDVVGRAARQFKKAAIGITVENNTTDIVLVKPKVTSFPTGIGFSKFFTDTVNLDQTNYVIIEPQFNNVSNNYKNVNTTYDKIMTMSQVVPGQFSLNLTPLVLNSGGGVIVAGTKTDTLGTMGVYDVNGVVDSFNHRPKEVIGVLANDGYKMGADGVAYMILEQYYGDRLDGDLQKIGQVISLASIQSKLGASTGSYKLAFNAGSIDLTSKPPTANGEAVATKPSTDVWIRNVIGNDSDPEGDKLTLDGVAQPLHGQSFQQGNDILYRPDLEFVGTDKIKYWVTDGNGNFSPAFIAINVDPSSQPPAPIPSPQPTDTDGDGVPDSSDNCQNVPNPGQEDADKDGIGDVCDSTPNPPPTDTDGDTVPDSTDNCPTVANTDQKDSDGDGLGDVCDSTPLPTPLPSDTDGDGVLDANDNCPNVVNSGQEDTDGDGKGDACDDTPYPIGTSKFKAGDQVRPNDTTQVRATPNGTSTGTQNRLTTGIVGSQKPALVSGKVWIYIDFPSGADGWVDEIYLDLIPPPDADNDGVPDASDNCPNVANADQADNDADGIGNVCDSTPNGDLVDTDKDGIPDSADNCPNVANADQKDTDDDGIGDACDSTPNGDDPPTASSKFDVGNTVETTKRVNVRLVPAGKVLGKQPLGSVGTITNLSQQANGITWWQVNFNSSKDGWVEEDFLIKQQ